MRQQMRRRLLRQRQTRRLRLSNNRNLKQRVTLVVYLRHVVQPICEQLIDAGMRGSFMQMCQSSRSASDLRRVSPHAIRFDYVVGRVGVTAPILSGKPSHYPGKLSRGEASDDFHNEISTNRDAGRFRIICGDSYRTNGWWFGGGRCHGRSDRLNSWRL